MRILVANFFPGHSPPRSGGEQRYFHLYRHLSRWHDVTLLSANFAHSPVEYVEHSPSFREYRAPKPPVTDQLHWELTAAGIGDECSAFVVGVSGAVEGTLRTRFRELLQYADVVVHESPFTFPLDETAYSDGKPRVYASYNVEHRLAAQMLHGESGAAAASFIRFMEGMLVARADLVFATSEDERIQFAADFGADPAKIRLAPNGFEPEENPAASVAAVESVPFVVFLGSAHPPNVEAGRFIRDALAPALPGLEFRIMGSVCARLEGEAPPNVKLLGFVEEGEMRRQLRTCAAALNPLFTGAGTNLKMLQYMEAGAPILTTEIGARGLLVEREIEVRVREPAQFADELRSLVAEPRRWEAMGAAGRRKAYARYSWGEIAGRYAEALEELPLSLSRGARRRVLHVNDYPVTDLMGGGQVRILEMLRELSAEFDLQLLCFTREGTASEARIGQDARQRAFPITAGHRDAESRADAGQGISVRDIVAGEWVMGNEPFVAAFKAALPHSAAVVFEHPYLAPLLDLVPAKMPVVYASQNVETDLKRALLAGRRDAEHWTRLAAQLEERMATRADAIVAVCESDASVFRARYPGKPVLLIENGVALPAVPALAAPMEEGGRISAAFLGSSHPPNIDATRFILERLAPALPGIDFHIVGSVCQAVAHLRRPGNVTLHGVVSDEGKARVLGDCQVAINPVAVGGGSSLKVPDFLAAGLPLVSTATGARGFELQPGVHYIEACAEDFAARLDELARDPKLRARIGRAGRRAIRRMAWPVLGARYRRFLRSIARRRPRAAPRILVATYRLMDPAPGGAESYLNHLLAHLGTGRGVTIDVAACDVGSIQDHWSFSARYGEAMADAATPRGVARVFRFALDPPAPDTFAKCRQLHSAWMAESCRQWRALHDRVAAPCLLGGWNHAERSGDAVWRWSGVRAQVGVPAGTEAIRIEASSHGERRVALRPARGVASEIPVSGAFSIEAALDGSAQIVELEVDQPLVSADDPRELGVAARRVCLLRGGEWSDVDMRSDGEQRLRAADSQAWIDSLIDVTEERDRAVDDLFLEVRGPHSRDMREWLEAHVHEYDAVIVQGTPFAPIAWVPPIARAGGVPVALLPHFHVEDRYYHWNGYYRAFREADCVLAAPDSTKPQFFDRIDAASAVIPGGGIELEEFTAERLAACRAQFERVHSSRRPYALVLGRKALAKRYPLVLEAALQQAGDPDGFDIVMIGPDDDGLPINQPGVHYYGGRPRDFVLGALAGSVCLVNMSESESFGIVLLESWAAGRPVVVQRRCVAFTELVRDGENGFLAETPEEIRARIRRYVEDAELARQHAAAGKELSQRFSWEALAARAYEIVVEGMLAPALSPGLRERDARPYLQDAVASTLGLLQRGEVHDSDFEAFRQWPGLRVECIMDIGANRGQSVASLHSVFPGAVIHSFEANAMLFPVLDQVAAALGGKCIVHRYGLGRGDGGFKLYIPWAGGQPWLEESSTRRDYYDKPWVADKFAARGTLELQEVDCAIRGGDALGLDPQVIKVDVEGAEDDVISGLTETISRARPILLVENSDWHRVTATLAALGYRPFRWEPAARRLVPFHGATTNTFYLHETAHAALAAMAGSRGVIA